MTREEKERNFIAMREHELNTFIQDCVDSIENKDQYDNLLSRINLVGNIVMGVDRDIHGLLVYASSLLDLRITQKFGISDEILEEDYQTIFE